MMKKNLLLSVAFILAATLNTVLGQTPSWTITGPSLFPVKTIGQVHGIGRISQFKFHTTNANKMYCTSATGGLWYSANKGLSWSVLGTDKYNYSSASVAVDPTNDQVIYWGTGDANYYGSGSGVLKSIDGGNNFTLSNTGMGNRLVIDMIFLPTDNKTIIAATNGGIFRSTDAGANWVLKSASDAFQDICFKPGTNGQTVFATASKAYYRSLDAGNTWTKISSPAFIFGGNGTRVACPAVNPSVVYVVNMGAADATEVYRSTDGGATFTSQRASSTDKLTGYDAGSTGQGNYNFDIEVNPANASELYICAHVIWRTTNGGVNWTKQQPSWAYDLHTDQHQLVFDPYVAGQLWNCNDGGVFSNTTNGTGAWANKSDGLACTEIYRAAISNISPDYAYIGTQDNGGFYYKTGTWYNDRGGDWGAEEFFDFAGNNVYDNETSNRKTLPNTSKSLNLPFTPSNSNRTKFAFTPANIAIGYCVSGTGVVYRCSNLAAATLSWTQIYTLPSGTAQDIEVDPGNADVLYIINNGTNVFRSDNATTTASFTTLTLPSSASGKGFLAPIKSTSVVYASANNKIYRSADKGATWTATTGFPASNINGLVADRFSTIEAIYASYNLGVYYKDNSKASWVSYGQGLPVISDITDLMIYNNSSNQGLLRVSYYGRSMWQTPLVSAYQNITVALTSPANNTTVSSPASINLSATASAVTGSITKVEFYAGTTLLTTVTTAPYTYTWSNVPFGTYAITAKAYDNTGASKSSVVANITVNLVCTKLAGTTFGTSPAYAAGSEYDKAFDGNTSTFFDFSGASTGYTGLDFGAAATVYAVRYFARSGQEGRMAGGIFQASNVANFSSGVVNLDTIAEVNSGVWNESSFPANTKYRYFRYMSPANGYCNVAEIEFCGTSNQTPAVALTSPTNNQLFTSSPNTIGLAATATDPDGTISKVEFYQGTTLIGSDASSPYTFSWTNVADGTYSLTAIAYDNLNATKTSSAVSIIVGNQNPVVSITSPANNANFAQPASVTINATASDPDGTVSKVEFYNGTTLLGSDVTSPYTYTWSGVAAGNYVLTAKAYDNRNAIATSAVVNIRVGNQAPSVNITSPSNNSAFSAPASITINSLASDADGTVSKVEFYHGTTLLGFDATSPYSFSWTGVTAGTYAIKAIAYDNLNLTATSAIVNVTVGSGCSFAAWSATTTYLGDAGLGNGKGEVVSYNGKQYRAMFWTQNNQPDLNNGTGQPWTDLGACAAFNQPPVISMTAPENDAVVAEGTAITITVSASSPKGTVSKVEFYNGTTLLVSDDSSPYTYSWTGAVSGTYQLVAVVTDNFDMTTTSEAVSVVVNKFPTVTLTSPVNHGSYTVPASVSLAATASDADGTISKVEFYEGTTLLGTSKESPYMYTWSNVPQGTYQITAKAYDDLHSSVASSVTSINVSAVTTLHDIRYDDAVTIYPNPSRGQFSIGMEGMQGKKISYSILDQAGQEIISETSVGAIDLAKFDAKVNLHTASGTYLVKMTIDGEIITKKVHIVSMPKAIK